MFLFLGDGSPIAGSAITDQKAYTAYRTASNVGRPLIEVVTPRNIANDRTGPN